MKTQKWNIQNINKRIDKYINSKNTHVTSAIYETCVAFAKEAKKNHSYRNYKGQLESSVGVIVLKDLNEVKEWFLLASSGYDPIRGIRDLNNVINKIVGKNVLPDGTTIPSIGIVGIVFAAAPYSSLVASRGRTVLKEFAPNPSTVYEIIKIEIEK